MNMGIYGTYHPVETHLQQYLNEFDFRYNNRKIIGLEGVQVTEDSA